MEEAQSELSHILNLFYETDGCLNLMSVVRIFCNYHSVDFFRKCKFLTKLLLVCLHTSFHLPAQS